MVGFLPNIRPKSGQPTCESGVYLACECKEVEFQRDVIDYWTTWSSLFLWLAIAITVVALYNQKINPILYAFLVFALSNSLAVAIAAQILFETTEVFEEVDSSGSLCPATIDETRFKKTLMSNTLGHILPIFGSLFILLCLSTGRIPGIFMGKPVRLSMYSSIMWIGFSLIYSAIPSEGTVFLSKFERVYFQDDVGIMASLPVLYFLFVVVISFFVASKTQIPFLL